jgi:hypothetical protein
MAKLGEARSLAASGDKAAAAALLETVSAETKGTAWENIVENTDGVIDRFDGFRKISFSDQLTALRGAMAPSDAADIAAGTADEAADDVADAPAAAAEEKPAEEPKEESSEQ